MPVYLGRNVKLYGIEMSNMHKNSETAWKINKNILLLITSILFTIPHVITLFNSVDLRGDLLALPKYVLIGWMLGSYYYKNNDIGRVVFVHMVYNIISFVLMTMTLSLI